MVLKLIMIYQTVLTYFVPVTPECLHFPDMGQYPTDLSLESFSFISCQKNKNAEKINYFKVCFKGLS